MRLRFWYLLSLIELHFQMYQTQRTQIKINLPNEERETTSNNQGNTGNSDHLRDPHDFVIPPSGVFKGDWEILINSTFTSSEGEYNYQIRPFKNITQTKLYGNFLMVLGIWDKWNYDSESNTLIMSYSDGIRCGDTPRQVNLRLECLTDPAQEPYIDEIKEPTPCNYSMSFHHKLACAKERFKNNSLCTQKIGEYCVPNECHEDFVDYDADSAEWKLDGSITTFSECRKFCEDIGSPLIHGFTFSLDEKKCWCKMGTKIIDDSTKVSGNINCGGNCCKSGICFNGVCSYCTDWPGWHDSQNLWFGEVGCSFYALGDNCEYYGNGDGLSENITANQACCACGGGTKEKFNDEVEVHMMISKMQYCISALYENGKASIPDVCSQFV